MIVLTEMGCTKVHKKHKVKRYRDYSLIASPRWIYLVETNDQYYYYISTSNIVDCNTITWSASKISPISGNRLIEEEGEEEVDVSTLSEDMQENIEQTEEDAESEGASEDVGESSSDGGSSDSGGDSGDGGD